MNTVHQDIFVPKSPQLCTTSRADLLSCLPLGRVSEIKSVQAIQNSYMKPTFPSYKTKLPFLWLNAENKTQLYTTKIGKRLVWGTAIINVFPYTHLETTFTALRKAPASIFRLWVSFVIRIFAFVWNTEKNQSLPVGKNLQAGIEGTCHTAFSVRTGEWCLFTARFSKPRWVSET